VPPRVGVLDEVLALDGVRTFWLQFGLFDDAVAARAESAGLEVVMERCLKVEHARFGVRAGRRGGGEGGHGAGDARRHRPRPERDGGAGDGAAAQIRTDPERAERALRTMGETGRTGLAELRRVLDVLREDGPTATTTGPGHDLVALAEQMTVAGLPTRAVLTGSLLGLPGTVSSGLYRIAQVSLTNALRHGGAGSHAVVEVVVREGEVELSVRDDGAGARGAPSHGGNGLTGMRERAHACGGTLSAGPDPARGGWTVRAVLPT
jgi:hypothetical protein